MADNPPAPLTTSAELDALPVMAVVLNQGVNPHAWQKRLIIDGQDNRSTGWVYTSDSDWPVQPAQMLHDHESFIVLWLPDGPPVTNALLTEEAKP